MATVTNTCEECGESFIGRTDKKFCSDSCRSTHNNKRNSDINNFVRKINNRLRKNRRILADINPSGKTKIHRDKLVAAGFSFNYFTNVYRTKNGNTYFFVYDQGYLKLEDGWLALVRKKEYVE